jgi:urea carboxylase system permease
MDVTAARSATADSDELAEFGYRQELDRTLGNFHTFAAGISYISILTGTFQLFYFGFAFGGPAYWWSWPMVFCGQLMVALCFCELAARFPVAGSIYNWAKRLSTPHVAWLAGWMMLTASIVTVAAVALAYQITLPQISDFFQFYGDGTGKYDYAANAVILGTALIIFTTIINAIGVKLMAQINSTGVFIELIAAVLLIGALAVNITRGPDVVTETQGRGADWELGYLGAFLAASLASAYVMYGFDTASSLGEESLNPRKNAPRAILRALIASFVIGGLIILLAMMAVTDITAAEISTGGLQFIVLDVLGNTIGDIFLWSVVIAITVCCLAVHTAAIRMMFAMARDNNLPAGEHLARIDPRTKTPIIPAVLIGLLAILILVVNIRQPQIFVVITSIGIIMIYIAYLLVTGPMLLARIRGRWRSEDAPEGYFTLGRWGFAINLAAVVWGLFMATNLIWPRQSVYNATEPFHWYLKWGGVLFVGAVMLGGFAYYWFVQRHKTGTLAAHALEEPGAAAPAIAGGGATE